MALTSIQDIVATSAARGPPAPLGQRQRWTKRLRKSSGMKMALPPSSPCPFLPFLPQKAERRWGRSRPSPHRHRAPRRARPARLDQRQEPVKKGNEPGGQDALSWNGAARRRDIFSLQAFVEKSPEINHCFRLPGARFSKDAPWRIAPVPLFVPSCAGKGFVPAVSPVPWLPSRPGAEK